MFSMFTPEYLKIFEDIQFDVSKHEERLMDSTTDVEIRWTLFRTSAVPVVDYNSGPTRGCQPLRNSKPVHRKAKPTVTSPAASY
ncbi:hypothetical protein CHS0354_025044 [Potamilus streckersoni]|uniref:Uncharacterized protein n=1 Tax=Potamilus streckersoni TaxID=2493646 RepID=A0AAE0T993_9BIVA|nr:hypothetical protein CHS0354_025044 [Potamilus streckersoni]